MFSQFHFNFTYKPKGVQPQPAQMYVCWNNGYCWGRIVLKDGSNLDVYTGRDYYNDHTEGANAFERAANRGKAEPSKRYGTIAYDPRQEEA